MASVKIMLADCKKYADPSFTEEESILGVYNSLSELNEDWEDYTPKESLIKDPKIRKAVRAWAEANEIDISDTVFYSEGFYKFSGNNCSIDFKMPISGLDSDNYTIAELCGEEE